MVFLRILELLPNSQPPLHLIARGLAGLEHDPHFDFDCD